MRCTVGDQPLDGGKDACMHAYIHSYILHTCNRTAYTQVIHAYTDAIHTCHTARKSAAIAAAAAAACDAVKEAAGPTGIVYRFRESRKVRRTLRRYR